MKVKIFKEDWDIELHESDLNEWLSKNDVLIDRIIQTTPASGTIYIITSIFYTELGDVEFQKVK
jgi:hypothetical protein